MHDTAAFHHVTKSGDLEPITPHSPSTAIDGNTPIIITLTFSENINRSEFSLDDIQVYANDDIMLSELSPKTIPNDPQNKTQYTLKLTPNSADGYVDIIIPINKISDIAGNTNTDILTIPTIYFDSTWPIITSFTANTSSSSSIANNSKVSGNTQITFTVTFSETVFGFSNDDANNDGMLDDIAITGEATDSVSITSGPLFHSNNTYTFVIESFNANGDIEISIPAGAVTDNSGRQSKASNKFILTFDSLRPTTAISSNDITSGDKTNADNLVLAVTFNDADVFGLTQNDINMTFSDTANSPSIILSNSTITNDAFTTYTLTITHIGTDDQDITLSIPENVASDPAGNGNIASIPYAFSFDNSNPQVSITTINSTVPDLITTPGTVKLDVLFTEPVFGFNSSTSDISITGSALQSGPPQIAPLTITPKPNTDGAEYTFTIPFAQNHEGRLDVQILQDVAIDAAGNPNSKATSSPISFNLDNPTKLTGQIFVQNIDLLNGGEIPASSTPISFIVVFYGQVDQSTLSHDYIMLSGNAFETDDISLNIGTGGKFQIKPTENTRGRLSITIPAGLIKDDHGNDNEKIEFTLTFIAPSTPTVGGPYNNHLSGDSSSGGGKTTPLLASHMILYNTCSQNQDAAVRILTFNLPAVDNIQANLYNSKFVSYGVDVTAQVPVSTYLTNINSNHVYTIFDAKLPVGTKQFFVTVFDTDNPRWTSSTLLDLTDPTSSTPSSTKCANVIYPHELKDPNTQFLSFIEPLALETLPIPLEQLDTKLLGKPTPTFENDPSTTPPSIDSSVPTTVTTPTQSSTPTPTNKDINNNTLTSLDSSTIHPNTNPSSLDDAPIPTTTTPVPEPTSPENTPSPITSPQSSTQPTKTIPPTTPNTLQTNTHDNDNDRKLKPTPSIPIITATPPPPPPPATPHEYYNNVSAPTPDKLPSNTQPTTEPPHQDQEAKTESIFSQWISHLFDWLGLS